MNEMHCELIGRVSTKLPFCLRYTWN